MMKETAEFRIPEEHAERFLGPHEGKRLSDTLRVLEIPVDDPRYAQIGEIDRQLQKEGRAFFLGWRILRRYSHKELDSAKLFSIEITAVFEPAGEECGTVYDDSTACPVCQAGRTQRSDLVLDLRKVPRGKDIACTIADEWIVSQRLAERLVDAKMTGFELRPVHHKASYQDDPVDLAEVPSGRELLRQADEAGVPFPTWSFWVWLNRSEQKELADRATEEHATLLQRHDRHRHRPIPVWYQLLITSPPVLTVPPTRFGVDPFDDDPEGRYRCPLGHVSGLNLLSELWISSSTWDESDVVRTANMVGIRRGLLTPTPLLVISPRLWRLLRAERVKGYQARIAHLK